jgi:S-disulfanyl-L-cysteine oxidoreductase SoxD
MKRLYVLLAALLLPATAVAQTTEAKPGLVPAAQAANGENVFKIRCSECHATTDFTKSDFARAWDDRPLFELFEKVRSTMPDDKPGTYLPQEYLDVVLYIYKLNGAAEGEGEIKPDEAAMKAVKYKMKLEGKPAPKPYTKR